MRSRRVIVAGLAVVACASLLAACDTGNGSSTTGTIPSVTPSTKPFTYKKLRANLQVTGADALTINGVVGQCRFPADGLPPAYIIKDLPQLGRAGSVIVWGPTNINGYMLPGNVKVLLNGVGLVSAASGAGVTVQPDLQSATLNADLFGIANPASIDSANDAKVDPGVRRDHIAGTVRCT